MCLNRNIGAKPTMQERIRWISSFFRKNLFTISSLVGFLFMLFVIIHPFQSKQISNNEILNKLKQENKQLKQENKDLESGKSFYMNKSDELKKNLDSSIATVTENNIENQKHWERLQTIIKNELVDSLSIFSPEYTKKGDKITGLTVSDVVSETKNGSTSYHIDFTGEFKVRGTIVSNDGDGYLFMVKENVEKLPHTLQEFEGVSFAFANNDEVKRQLGEKLVNFTPMEGQFEVDAVFKNYAYHYVPEADWKNGAEFVRLISQN